MTAYELTNNQRQYFGLVPVGADWQRFPMNESVIVYFDKEKIVKILNYNAGYVEYDTNIDTLNRQILLPKTSKGKEQKLTVAKLLKVKGSGILFSGSFNGGNINVYDNRRNTVFIKSFSEEGNIRSYQDIDNWVSAYISNLPKDYFTWLKLELGKKRLKVIAKQGDFIAFRTSQNEFGFARVLSENYGFFRSVVIAAYGYHAGSLQIDVNILLEKKTLPAIRISDIDIYRGTMPVIGHADLSTEERQIQLAQNTSMYLTIPYTKTEIEKFIASNI